MRTVIRTIVAVSWVFAMHGGVAFAEQAAGGQTAMDPAKQAAMEKMQQLGSPSEGHKVLEPFVGSWTYSAQWWMAPDGPPESMTGSATNSMVFGGRFLKQEIRGEAPGQPPFEGVGYTGYDNLRKEYQSIWLDNMATGMMWATGQFDPSTKALTTQGDFSCPMTGETHRKSRSVWKVVDQNHTIYESDMSGPDGREFKAMEIHYTRAQ